VYAYRFLAGTDLRYLRDDRVEALGQCDASRTALWRGRSSAGFLGGQFQGRGMTRRSFEHGQSKL
jgi:hypothetical protein